MKSFIFYYDIDRDLIGFTEYAVLKVAIPYYAIGKAENKILY